MATYVPAGKTSLIKRSGITYQLQTEYAYRPYPRITTTILHEGQVIKKIERKLETAIESIEEQNRIQDIIQGQHNEVFRLIRDDSTISKSRPENPPQPVVNQAVEKVEQPKVNLQTSLPTENNDGLEIVKVSERKSILDRFSSIPGIEHVYQLNNEGEFQSQTAQKQFRKDFKKTFKIIAELLDIFPILDQETFYRESGVYVIEQDRLYFVSNGKECYFISIIPDGTLVNFEEAIKVAVFGVLTN
ncbi:MAG: hypothetical protein ABIJ12_15135 [bacterium]